MRKRLIVLVGVIALFALAAVASAGATVTAPTVDVASYGDSLFSGWGSALSSVWPYAAAATVAAATVSLVFMFIGHRKLPGTGGGKRR